MIRPAQLKLIERACLALTIAPAEFDTVLRRCGGADRTSDLTAAGYARLMDHFTVTGFKCRERPTLSAGTRKLIEATRLRLRLSDHTYLADLRGHAGVSDLRDLSGRGLIQLLTRWEYHGLDVQAFVAARCAITPAQLRLIQLARKRIGIEDARYYLMLQDYGGVVSASDLDQRGFDLAMAFLEAEGFDREPLARAQPDFGRRPGFASPEQVELIRALWREWTGSTGESEATIEASLNTWLERYQRASSLRFLTTGGAGKAITALKAMKARKGSDAREVSHA